jgi:hypothetical protein
MMFRRSFAVMAFSLVAGASFATFHPVTTKAALGANDFIDWGQFGAEFTAVPSPSHGFTNGGIGFTVTSDDDFGNNDSGGLERRDEDSGWAGEFQPGDKLLWHQASFINDGGALHSVLKIVFDSEVTGVGTQAQSNAGGDFTVNAGYWDPFSTYNNGFSVNSGTNNLGGHSGDAYTGGWDDAHTMNTFFVVAFMSDGSDNFGFAVGQVDVRTAVPEPATMAVLGLGALALIRRRRNK